MERTITITEKDYVLFNYTKDINDGYIKEYLSNAVEHYEKLCGANGDFAGYISPEDYKERIKSQSLASLKKERNRLIKNILEIVFYLDGLELDYATFRDANPNGGEYFFFNEDSYLGPIYFYIKRVRVLDELLKEKQQDK